MNPKVLTAFVSLAEIGHFGKAAEALSMTQSGLSQLVKKLEGAVGAKLLNRTTRSVALTDVGQIFLDNAREILQAHRLADERMANALKGEGGTVRLGFVASAALGIVPTLAALIHVQAPAMKLSLLEMTSEEQIPRLRTGDIDVGVLREISQSPGLLISPLLNEPLVAAIPHSHPLSTSRHVSLKSLRDEGFIMFPRGKVSFLHDHIHRLCFAAGFTPRIVEEAVQFATILGLVSSNAGIAIVPRSLMSIQLPQVVFLPIADKSATSQVYIARRTNEKSSPATKKLVSIATAAPGLGQAQEKLL